MKDADALRAAAEILEDHAAACQKDIQKSMETGGFWGFYKPERAWRDGFINGMGGECSELVALFPPEVALMLAKVFTRWAHLLEFDAMVSGPPPIHWGKEETVALARQIIAEEAKHEA